MIIRFIPQTATCQNQQLIIFGIYPITLDQTSLSNTNKIKI